LKIQSNIVLRAGLRQDPDIVMVGEMRDKETSDIALRAAMTGHLVLSTLHTNDAISTALRLIEMGAKGYVVASSLRAVMAQRLVRKICENCIETERLVRKICENCIETDPLEPATKTWINNYSGRVDRPDDSVGFKKGRGCPGCNNTGYSGRVGIFELLEINFELADALRRNDSAEFAQIARDLPQFVTLADNALVLAINGVTSMDEVLRVSGEVEG